MQLLYVAKSDKVLGFCCFLLQLLEVITQEITYRLMQVITSCLMSLSRAISEANKCLDSNWREAVLEKAAAILHWGVLLGLKGCATGLGEAKRQKTSCLPKHPVQGYCKADFLQAPLKSQGTYSMTDRIFYQNWKGSKHQNWSVNRLLAVTVMCFQLWGVFSRACRHMSWPGGAFRGVWRRVRE